jgi:hypothetical protein
MHMPVLDAVFVGKVYLPEISQGPIVPPPGSGGGVPVFPAHPIAPGGGGGVVSPPIYYPPSIWPGPGGPVFPAHPIAPGGPPPVAGWTPPGYHPAHPIAPGGQPPGIWGGGNMPVPVPPIFYPPVFPVQPLPPIPPPGGGGTPPGGGMDGNWEWVWTPGAGWNLGFVPGDKPTPPGGTTPPDPNAPVPAPV